MNKRKIAGLVLIAGIALFYLGLGKPEIKTTYGYVSVTIGSAEPAAGLVKPGTILPGRFEKKTGSSGILKPEGNRRAL